MKKLFKVIHEMKNENNLDYAEVAIILEGIARHYRWYEKEQFKSEVEEVIFDRLLEP